MVRAKSKRSSAVGSITRKLEPGASEVMAKLRSGESLSDGDKRTSLLALHRALGQCATLLEGGTKRVHPWWWSGTDSPAAPRMLLASIAELSREVSLLLTTVPWDDVAIPIKEELRVMEHWLPSNDESDRAQWIAIKRTADECLSNFVRLSYRLEAYLWRKSEVDEWTLFLNGLDGDEKPKIARLVMKHLTESPQGFDQDAFVELLIKDNCSESYSRTVLARMASAGFILRRPYRLPG